MTSPLLPALVTEGDTVEEALANVHDALAAVVEAYEDLGRTLPANVCVVDTAQPLWLENRCHSLVKYRDITEKLRALGCQELPRRSEGSHASGIIRVPKQVTLLPDWGRRDLKLGTVRLFAN